MRILTPKSYPLRGVASFTTAIVEAKGASIARLPLPDAALDT
jgi:hypothetical protein